MKPGLATASGEERWRCIGDALQEGREESERVYSALSFQALGAGSSSGHNLQIQQIFGCLTPLRKGD